jgi:transposase
VDGLIDAGFPVKLANTRAVKVYDGLKHSGDEADARHLAHLARLGILPTGHVHPKATRGLRDLARRRQQLVHTRTAYILSVQNQVVRQTGRPLLSNAVKRLDHAAIDKLKLPADVGVAMAATLEVVRALGAEIEKIEAHLMASQCKGKNWKLINSVPGIGKTLGAIILLETGAIERFASPGNFASYARCIDSIRVSNGKKKGEGNTKNGNKYLAWAFVEAAHFAARF